jgi:hypothetical protein
MHSSKVKEAINTHIGNASDYKDRFKHKTELRRIKVDRKEASFFLSENFNKNRSVSKGKVKEYVSKIRQNEFNFNAVTLAFCVLPDGKEILVNGQHCSFAILESDIEIEIDAKYHFVNDMTDVENYYTTYDIGRTRNMRDRISAIGLFDDILFTKAPDKNVVANACKMIIKGFRNHGAHNLNAQNPRIVSSLSASYSDAINRALTIKNLCEVDVLRRFLNRPAVFGVMILTLDMENNDKAIDFWTRIAINEMGKKGDPIHAILKSVLDGKFMRKAIYEASSYNIIAKAWNFYYQEKQMILIVQPPSEPIKLFLK